MNSQSAILELKNKVARFNLRLSLADQILFTKRLSVLINSGIPLLDSLKLLNDQTNNQKLQKTLNVLVGEVEAGRPLYLSMRNQGKSFNELAISLVEVGEHSASLADGLEYLAVELKKQQVLKRKILSALIYPVLIVVATLLITFFLSFYLFPKILPIFQSFDMDLPPATKALIFASDFLLKYGWLLFLALILLLAICFYLKRNKVFRYYLHRWLLSLPFFGRLIRHYQMANFSRTLRLLLRSGCPIEKALKITCRSTNNECYRKNLHEMSEKVSSGATISSFLKEFKLLYPQVTVQMIHVGEQSGKLADNLDYLSGFHESEVDDITKDLTVTMEPVLMICMGILVGFVAIAIITPIYEVTQNLQP